MTNQIKPSRTILYSLVFLLFFQLVADFVETIYTFGLLETDIPPEIASIVLFFSPLILLFFRRGLSQRSGLILAGGVAVMRALEVFLDKGGKMLASGVGVGLVLVLLPVWLAQHAEDEDPPALEMGCGLAGAVAFSILFRVLGAGSDISLLYPGLSWVLAGILLFVVVRLYRETNPEPLPQGSEKSSFGSTAVLCVGILGTLAVLYFAFTSPLVLARWSGLDERPIVILLAAALGLYAVALVSGWLARLSKPAVLFWNALFVLAGAAAIWVNQVRFPGESGSYPLDQPEISLFQHIPLFAMILLSPAALIDFALLVREVKARRPALRSLAGGFALAALFLLIVVLGQAFTTVYDYIPVVGPWFRDCFWLVFLLAGLGMALPVLAVRAAPPAAPRPVLRAVFLPLVCAALLGAAVWVVANRSAPRAPADQAALRVMTYNIQQGYSGDGTRNYTGQLALIRELQPDIVGLQESDTARFSGGNADVVRTLAEGLDMYSYYGPRTVTGTFGIALLSRYPIENARTFYMYSTGEQTAAILAQIHVGGKSYTLLVTHLGNGGPMIQQQNVLERLEGMRNVIAMGDFNFDLASEQYALTLQTLDDAWVKAGSPPAPGLNLDNLIDHVFVSPGTDVRSAQYIVSPASDHPGLFVEIGN